MNSGYLFINTFPPNFEESNKKNLSLVNNAYTVILDYMSDIFEIINLRVGSHKSKYCLFW